MTEYCQKRGLGSWRRRKVEREGQQRLSHSWEIRKNKPKTNSDTPCIFSRWRRCRATLTLISDHDRPRTRHSRSSSAQCTTICLVVNPPLPAANVDLATRVCQLGYTSYTPRQIGMTTSVAPLCEWIKRLNYWSIVSGEVSNYSYRLTVLPLTSSHVSSTKQKHPQTIAETESPTSVRISDRSRLIASDPSKRGGNSCHG